MRRIPVVPIILAVITMVVIASVYWILKDFQRRALHSSLDPFTLIASDAEVIYHIRKPALFRESFTRTGPIGQDMDAALAGGIASDFVNRLDSLISLNIEIAQYWDDSEILLSLHPGINDQKNFLLQVSLPANYNPGKLKDFLRNSIFTDYTPGTHPDNKNYCFSLNRESSDHDLFFCFRHNILMISSGPIPVNITEEEAIVSDARFRVLMNSAGRFSDNLYARTHIACNFNPVMSDNSHPFHLKCTSLAGWQAWDVSYHAGEVFLTGFAQSEIYGQMFIDNLGRQQPVETEIMNHIPLHTRLIIYFGLSDTEAFAEDHEQWLKINNLEEEYYSFRSRFQDITTLHPDSMRELWSGEAAWVNPGLNEDGTGVLLLSISGISDLLQHPKLELFFSELAPPDTASGLYRLQVFKSNIPGLLPVISAGLVSADFDYISWSDNYLLAAHSAETLQKYTDAIRFGYSFERSTEAELMKELMQPHQNIFVYHSGKGDAGNLLKTYLNRLTDEDERENDQSASHHSFCLQILPSSGPMVFSNAMLLQREEYDFGSPLHWETEIPAPVHMGPYRVFNHNTGITEIILQDQSNMLHLIDLEGNILWNKEISGPIVSDIYQVDIFKNNRYQYLFNTRNYLHLIDRNGNYVRGYPMRLPAAASAGIAVFDYEQNKNYRILFPAENRRIYNYSLRREPVAGWQYRRSEHLITQPLQHIRLKGMDFLFATDTTGRVHILDRRGVSRLRPNQVVLAEPGLKIYGHTPLGGRAHFITPGPAGHINQVFTDGEVFGFVPDTLEGQFLFTYQPLISPPEKDLIFLHRGNLSVYSIASRLLFSLPIDRNMIAHLDVIPITGNNHVIAITDTQNMRLFVVTPEGEIPAPFPIPGDTRFFIEAETSGKLILITGFNNTIRKYLFDQKELLDFSSN